MTRTPGSKPTAAGSAHTARAAPTPAYLFTDLRGFDEVLADVGASDAAAALFRFRDVVRTAVAEHPGAEIKTEGESSYVVFPATEPALRCGLAIAEATAAGSAGWSALSVAVGIDAALPAMPDGFLGASAVCAAARPGEVVVTDRVRAQSRNFPVIYARAAPRQATFAGGSTALYVATRAAVGATTRGRSWRRAGLGRWVVLTAIVALLFAGGAWWRSQHAVGLPPGTWTIGMLVPEGDSFGRIAGDFGTQQVDAVQLALDEANAATWTSGAHLTLDARDEGNPASGEFASSAANILVRDTHVVAIVGPSASSHAELTIPNTNRAGLLMCSPANTRPSLTKPRFGALDLRSAFPDRISYVRLATSDDIQGPAAASYVFNDLGAGAVLIIDDTSDGGRAIADSFQAAFGPIAPAAGNIVRRALNPGTTDFSGILEPLRGTGADIGAIYFAGTTTFGDSPYAGPVLMKQAMLAMGFGDIPVQSWDGLYDGSGTDQGSFIQRTGAAAANTFATRSSVGPVSADFAARYRAAFGVEPNEYAAAAYACTQVILEGLRNAAQAGVDAASLREAVRRYVVDTAHRYQTVLGLVGFDANGDSIQQFVTFYRVDLGANGGTGDWVQVKQQDFGPAP